MPNKGEYDAIIVKYDENGNMQWQHSWGGNRLERFEDILQTEDGGFIAYGYSTSDDIEELSNIGYDILIVVKYDKDGNLVWQKSWGGIDSEGFNDGFQTEDGGFIAYGYFYCPDIEGLPNKGSDDLMIVKYDKDGNLMWQKSWGGNGSDAVRNGFQTEDGGLIAFGYFESTDIEGLPNKGSEDAIIVRYDKDGNLMWQKSWGGNSDDYFANVVQTKEGEFIAYGWFCSTDIEGLPNKGECDAIIVKYDKDGNLMWQKSWGGIDSEVFNDGFQTEDGGFIVSGYSYSTDIEGLTNKGNMDAIIVKYDKDGNMLWQTSWGGNDIDIFDDVLQTKNGEFIATGYLYSTDIEGLPNKGEYDVIIVKYDKDGNVLWQTSWGGNYEDNIIGKLLLSEGGFIVDIISYSSDIEGLPNKGSEDAIIVKYSVEYDLENITTENGTSTIEQQGKYGIIVPRPNEGYEVDQIIVKDKDGNILEVEIIKLEDGTYSFELYTDVSVEVTFKEKIENPKTGILDMITILFIGAVISTCGFILVKRYNERYEI